MYPSRPPRRWSGGRERDMAAHRPQWLTCQAHRMFRHFASGVCALLLAMSLVVLLGACAQGSQPASAPPSDPAEPAALKIEPAPGAQDVDPVAPVSVSAQTGTLT